MPVFTPEKPAAKGERPLENGEHLDAEEFLRRYEAMPDLKKAELIQGIVYIMASPVSAGFHGAPDNIIQMWLGVYCSATPGTDSAANSTTILNPRNVPQPDAMLRILSESGGKSQMDEEGYILGGPELAVEIAASSTAMDAHKKRDAYANAGVQEYILWRTLDNELDWWTLEAGTYRNLPVGTDGIIRSKVFPGLWLNRAALLQRNRPQIMSSLQQGLATEEHRAFVESLAAAKQKHPKQSPPR
jgi:Uma2 family endonuclease